MSFDEIRLPENIDYGFTSGTEYSTDIVELFSGFEQRNQNWSLPRIKYTAARPIMTAADVAVLIAFFRMRKGRANGFRFRDWTDYSAIAQNIGTGDGANKIFQLRKLYSSSTTEYRICKKIVASGSQVSTVPKIYVDSVLKTEITDYALDYNTGIVTFVTAPANTKAVTADFEFDIPVRFDTDTMQIRHEYGHEFYWDNITLIELKI